MAIRCPEGKVVLEQLRGEVASTVVAVEDLVVELRVIERKTQADRLSGDIHVHLAIGTGIRV